MIPSSIPPRTMSTLSRARRAEGGGDPPRGVSTAGAPFKRAPVTRVRQWRYQTRPSFKRVRGPLVDVFEEAEEVLIIVDLGGFTRGEISLNMSPEQYVLEAGRGDQSFREVIDLPPHVDVNRSEERLVNGVLEIVLPRQAVPVDPVRGRPRRRR